MARFGIVIIPKARVGRRRIARYVLEVLGGFVPLAGGLFSAVASMWSDREADATTRTLLSYLQAYQAHTLSTTPNLIMTEHTYRTEVARLQSDLRGKALYINRPRFFNSRWRAADRTVDAMIYSSMYQRKIDELVRRKKISDRLYELEITECGLAHDDERRRAIILQRINIKYGKGDGLAPVGSLLMAIVPRR